MLERFRETSAYEKLSKEAGALGDRLIEELSTAAQVVVLPALLKKIKNWIGVDLSDKKHQASMGGSQPVRSRQEASSSTYQPVLERSS
jgi:DNA mismatch repair protein MutH